MTHPISDLTMMQSPGAWPMNLILPLKKPKGNGDWPTYGVLRYHPGPDEFSFYEGPIAYDPKKILEATPDKAGLKTSDLQELADAGWLVD